MTPNGALAVAFVLIALSMSSPGPRGTALLLMLTLADGRERSEAEWRDLLEAGEWRIEHIESGVIEARCL